MDTRETSEPTAEAVFAALTGLSQQAVAELEEHTLQSLRQALTSASLLLLEQHLWRLGTRALAFALHGDNNRHAAAAFAIRELAGEIHQSQAAVLDLHQRNIHAEIERRGDVLNPSLSHPSAASPCNELLQQREPSGTFSHQKKHAKRPREHPVDSSGNENSSPAQSDDDDAFVRALSLSLSLCLCRNSWYQCQLTLSLSLVISPPLVRVLSLSPSLSA